MINKEASKQPKICSASDDVMLMMCDDKRTYEIFVTREYVTRNWYEKHHNTPENTTVEH